MRTEVLVAIISAAPALITAIVSVALNNRLVNYKLDTLETQFTKLETKIEKHNHVVERTAILERDTKTAFNKLDDLRDDINRIEDHMIEH